MVATHPRYSVTTACQYTPVEAIRAYFPNSVEFSVHSAPLPITIGSTRFDKLVLPRPNVFFVVLSVADAEPWPAILG